MAMKTVWTWVFEDHLEHIKNAGIQYTMTGRSDGFDNYECEMTMKEFYKYNDWMNEMGW